MRAQIIDQRGTAIAVRRWNTKHRTGPLGTLRSCELLSIQVDIQQTDDAAPPGTHTGCSTLRTTCTQGTVRNHQSNAIFTVIDTCFGIKNQAQRTSTQSPKSSGMQVVLEEGMWECCRV
jgi:hypothetical protein